MNAQISVQKVNLETDRLILRPWRQSDLEDFYEYAGVEGVGEKAGWAPHQSIEETQEILSSFIEEDKVLAIYHKADQRVIGSLGIELYKEGEPVWEPYQGREIGYVLSKVYWGQGLMPEAVEAVIDLCFNEWQLDFLVCGYFSHNIQSKRVQEKMGFEFVKEFDLETRIGTTERVYQNILWNKKKFREDQNVPDLSAN